MGRPSNTEERRKEIAWALARVMARSGYEGATVAAIASEAGVANGGVHYHFNSKKEILLDLVERLVAVAEERVATRAARARNERERLTAQLDGLIELDPASDHQAVATWALIGAEAVRDPEVRSVYSAWIGRVQKNLRTAFVQACRAEGRSTTDAAPTASALTALVEGSFAIAAGAPGLIPRGSAAPTARRIAIALLESQPRR